jgi:alpha-N-arabinofuranosidase
VGIDWSNTHFSLYPWWLGSVAEAVFLLGAERNADKIIGTTYVSFDCPFLFKFSKLTTWQAPFLMNLDSYEWSPTMISFNSNPDDTAKSTSWHVYNVSHSQHLITNT